MKRTFVASLFAAALSAAHIAAAAASPMAASPLIEESPQGVATLVEQTAAQIGPQLRDADFRQHLLETLQRAPHAAAPLQVIMRSLDPAGRSAVSRELHARERALRRLKGLPDDGVPLLQARLVRPRGVHAAALDPAQLRLAVGAGGDRRHFSSVRTWALDGTLQEIDGTLRPAFPLVMVEIDTRAALREGLRVVNAGLQAHGLQPMQRTRQGESLDVTRLDRIMLKTDQEPELKGAAEVFVVTSGLQHGDKAPMLRTFEMPWLDHQDTAYTPGQDWIHWDYYRYDVANVQLFEEDGNTNYKVMLSALLKAMATVIGPVQPTVGMVSLMADAILQAMPDAWYVDEHDYLDSYYLIQRGRSYTQLAGAAGNATVDLTAITLGGAGVQ